MVLVIAYDLCCKERWNMELLPNAVDQDLDRILPGLVRGVTMEQVHAVPQKELRLYRCSSDDFREPIVVLRVCVRVTPDGDHRYAYLRVPSDMTDAEAAAAWTGVAFFVPTAGDSAVTGEA
jgi:hypothetical protein